MIDRDSNGKRLLASDSSSLELLMRESSSLSELGVVTTGGASNGGSEEISGSVMVVGAGVE